MKFIDSNILAYAFYKNEFQENCQKAILEGGFIDTVNLVETFNTLSRVADGDVAARSIKGLLRSNLNIIDLDVNVIFEALKRVDKYKKLTFNDLIHYTCAVLHGCDIILSYDKDFDNLEIPRKEA